MKVGIPSPSVETRREVAAHFEHVLHSYLPTAESGDKWVMLPSNTAEGSLPAVIIGDDLDQALGQLREALDDEL